MTLRPPSRFHAVALGGLLVTACAATPPSPGSPAAASATPQPTRLAQLGYGRDAAFEQCAGDLCPRRTAKTFAQVAAPLEPATVPVASPRLATDANTAIDERKEILPVTPAVPTPVEKAQEVRQLDIQFAFASARLSPQARQALRELAPRLARAREVSLSGRTDSTGPAAANTWLAKARTEAVLRELAALSPGVAPEVTVDAQGACCYAEPNDHPAGRARNRRVEIRYLLDPDAPP